MGLEFCSKCNGIIDEVWKRTHTSSICRACHTKQKRHEYYLRNKEHIIEKSTESTKKYRAKAKEEKIKKEKRNDRDREKRYKNKRVSDEIKPKENKEEKIRQFMKEHGYIH
jgi:hypothetical protein